MITTVWGTANDPHEFAAFYGDVQEVPEYAVVETLDPTSSRFVVERTTAAVILDGMTKLEQPIWMHPETAHLMVAAGILEPDADRESVLFDRLRVLLYAAPS